MPFVDSFPVTGDIAEVHTSQKNTLGTIARHSNGNHYVYLKGVTSCADGSTVVFQPGVWTAVLVATGVKGQVAIATAAVDAATEFGWFTYIGQDVAISRSAVVSNVALFSGGVAGSISSTAVKGDQIIGAFARNAGAADGGSVIVQLDRANIGMTNESTG